MRRDRARPVPVPDGSRVGSGRSVIPRLGLSQVGVSCVIAPKLIEWLATCRLEPGTLMSSATGSWPTQLCIVTAVS